MKPTAPPAGPEPSAPRRRRLLLGSAGVAGALVVGWAGLPPRSRLGSADTLPPVAGEVGLNGWIKIQADGQVGLAMPYADMGQGVHHSLALLVAEELDVSPERVQLLEAPAERLYGNVSVLVASLPFHPRDEEAGQETQAVRLGRWLMHKLGRELGIVVTGGSSSMAEGWSVLRLAAATARGQLLGAASLRWKLPVAEFTVRDGVIWHGEERLGHYGELAAAAAVTRPGTVRYKPRAQWTRLGLAQPRRDVPGKCDGSARFGLDTRLPGLLFAAVRQAPMLGGAPGRAQVDELLRRPGVERVVRLGPIAGGTDGFAVVAQSTWHALQAARALEVDWQPAPGEPLDSAQILHRLRQATREAAASGGGHTFYQRGDAELALASASQRLEAEYRAPYLAHATLEPMNCTAQVRDGLVEVWAPTQAPSLARAVAARVAGVPEQQVRLHMTLLGGGFGRRLEVDSVGQAVRVALETGGRPVQLVWSREEDFSHDFYRPAGAALLQGGLDRSGRAVALRIHSAGDAVGPRWLARTLPELPTPEGADKTAAEGLFDLPYAVPNQHMAHVFTRSGVPVGNWRAVGHSHNAFFSEGFIDELAHAAGADPLAFRQALLRDRPRHAAVLALAAERAGWGTPVPAGRARGLALHESFGSIVAMVMEVSRGEDLPRVHRVTCAVDCGSVLQPDGVAQQVESSVVFGLTAALHGDIRIVNSQVQARGFDEQPLLRLRDTPLIETHIVPSQQAPTGMGEPALPPVAPALANAWFSLTGERLRELPLRPGAVGAAGPGR